MSAQILVTISAYEDGKFSSDVNVKTEMCSIENAREVQLDLADNLISYFRGLAEKSIEDVTENPWAKVENGPARV